MRLDCRAILAVLLVVQTGIGVLSALGMYAFARFSNAVALMAGQELIAFGGSAVLLVLGAGALSGVRLARFGIYLFEVLTMLGTALSALMSGGDALTLTGGLSGFVLPAAIILLLRGWHASRAALLTGLLTTTGVIHLWLAPSHLSEPPGLGSLLALDGAVFLALAIAQARGGRWYRAAVALVLVASIVAYLGVVLRGQESVDDLGLATKLVELLALALVLWPEGTGIDWRTLAAATTVVATIVVSGGLAWAASLRPGGGGHTHGHTLDGKVLIAAAAPTEQQRIAAADLVDQTRAGIERFSDVRVALADGYLPATPVAAPTVHYSNPTYARTGVVDPIHPQALVYATTPHGPVMLGAMFTMRSAGEKPPDIGGSLAEWHTHSNLCFSVPKFGIAGAVSPFGTCPLGSINAPTPAMLHVWTVPSPAGPFEDLPAAYVARLTRGDA